MSNPVGAWDAEHGGLATVRSYGEASYEWIAAEVADSTAVEDWGCGGGGLRAHIGAQRYRGIDGSATPFAEQTVDLRDYRSLGFTVVLRHVLEHNDEWQRVLTNAAASFHRKLVVVLFTPLTETTTVLRREPEHDDVPVIAFALDDLLDIIEPYAATVEWETRVSPETYYGVETMIVAAAP